MKPCYRKFSLSLSLSLSAVSTSFSGHAAGLDPYEPKVPLVESARSAGLVIMGRGAHERVWGQVSWQTNTESKLEVLPTQLLQPVWRRLLHTLPLKCL